MTLPTSQADWIRTRPGLYLGTKSLTALHHFYNGYNAAWHYRNPDANRDQHPLINIPWDFHDWVAYRTHYQESTGWCEMILTTTRSEEEAFDRFFLLLDEYQNREEKLIARIHDPESRIRSLDIAALSSPNPTFVEGPVIPAPKLVRIVSYTDDPGFFARYSEDSMPERTFFRDHFHPYLDHMRDHEGGRLEIVDQQAYQRLLWENANQDSLPSFRDCRVE